MLGVHQDVELHHGTIKSQTEGARRCAQLPCERAEDTELCMTRAPQVPESPEEPRSLRRSSSGALSDIAFREQQVMLESHRFIGRAAPGDVSGLCDSAEGCVPFP